MPADVVVIGAGGFGRETLDVLDAMNRSGPAPVVRLLGVVDDAPSALNLERLGRRGVAYLGTISGWLASRPTAQYLVGVGSPSARRRIDAVLAAAGLEAAVAVHPSAGVGSQCRFAPGTIVCAGVQVSTNVELGRHVHLNPNVTIGHDSVLEDFVSVNPNATVSGDCRLGAETYVGSSAVILQGLQTGAAATIGAAACVLRDIWAGVTVVGVPARELGAELRTEKARRH